MHYLQQRTNNIYRKYQSGWSFLRETWKNKTHKKSRKWYRSNFRFAKDGDLLGFRSFLSNQPYAVSAVTLEESTVCYIPKESFYDTIKKSENLTGSLFSKLNDELNFAEDRLSTISNKSLRERVAEALIIFEKTYGFLEDGKTINLLLSRDEIAQFIGTATESLIRFLSEFDKDGIIELTGKKIKILDLKKLKKTANLLD